MHPRTLLLAALLAGCGDDHRDAHYVLVHGAWMGSAGWAEVASALRDGGATVATPELPAHGIDPAPVSAASLASYAARVDAAIDAAGAPVILVGHSMAGLVISEVAARRPADIAELVYVAAYAPVAGDSLFALATSDADSQVGANLIQNPDGTLDLRPDAFPDLFCADCDAAARAALVAGYRAEPAAPLAEPVALGAGFAGVPKTYIHTRFDRVVSPALQARMVAATPMHREVTLETSHVPLLAAPRELAARLAP